MQLVKLIAWQNKIGIVSGVAECNWLGKQYGRMKLVKLEIWHNEID